MAEGKKDAEEPKAEEKRTYSKKERDKELGVAGGGPRAPPSLSLWLNADLFKRIVHRLANLPATSAAEHIDANVMRVVALSACVLAASSNNEAALLLHEGCTHLLLLALTGH